jgi:hypothetical protein
MANLQITRKTMVYRLISASFMIFFSMAKYSAQQTVIALQRDAAIEVLNEDSFNLSYPWTGGFNSCQISACDINDDNLKDLVIFDRSGNRLTLLNFIGSPGNPSWIQNADAEGWFPACTQFMLMRDLDCDGKEDIFTYSNSGIRVYHNDGFNGNAPQFSLYASQLQSSYNGSMLDVYCLPVDVPAIDDIDGDGDLDVLVFNLLGSCVEYHRNMAQENLNRCDTLVLRFESDNWGNFTESFSTNEVLLNDTCNSFGGGRFDLRHAGSAITSIDTDGDGDKELLLGDIAYRTITKLINGGSAGNALITAQEINYPPNTESVNIAIFPAAYHIDIDLDGKRDLVVSPNSITGAENYRSFLYYRNEGTEAIPSFIYQNNTLFSLSTLDFGEGAIPTFFDYNGDGKKDLLVGNYGYFLPNGNYKPQFALLENTSDENDTKFRLINRNYTSAGTLSGIAVNFHPTTGDLDSDGDADLLFGTSDGRIFHFENTALPGNNANFNFVTPDFEGIDVGTYAAPFLFDIDNNGKADLLVGTREGTVHYYRNTTTGNSPVMELQTTTFGNINTALPGESNGYATPFAFRKSGVTYVICGSLDGAFKLYGNIDGNLEGAFSLLDSTFLGNRLGDRTSICLSDLNDDGYPEAVVGNYAGGITFFSGIFPTWLNEPKQSEITLFPNPSAIAPYLQADAYGKAEITLTDIRGALLWNGMTQVPGFMPFVPDANGIYLVHVRCNNKSSVLKWIRQ